MLTRKINFAICIMIALALAPNAGASLSDIFSTENTNKPTPQHLNLPTPPRHIVNFRQKMRDNVNMLADYAHAQNKDFKIILHEGEYLLSKSLWEQHQEGYNQIRNQPDSAGDKSFLYRLSHEASDNKIAGKALPKFIKKIDGLALNNVFCQGKSISHVLKQSRLKLIAVDQCPDSLSYEEAIQESLGEDFLFYGTIYPQNSFQDIRKDSILNENAKNISTLQEAKNILIITDDRSYSKPYNLIKDLQNTNYDTLVIPALFHQKTPFSPEEIHSLKFKKNGTTRLVFAEFNISEASPNLYYWKKKWYKKRPAWLETTQDNKYIAHYWHLQWRHILGQHLQGIIQSGFNGIYITGLENHRYFEQRFPLE